MSDLAKGGDRDKAAPVCVAASAYSTSRGRTNNKTQTEGHLKQRLRWQKKLTFHIGIHFLQGQRLGKGNKSLALAKSGHQMSWARDPSVFHALITNTHNCSFT